MTDEPENGRRHEERGPNGRPDPSRNVLDLVEAGLKRQDDLREMSAKHQSEKAKLRAQYDDKLRRAESDRINAIRAVDVAAVQQAATVSATQATTLAAQVATSAETLRNQVAAAAAAQTTALAAALDPIQKDIADLRKTQYEQQGQKQTVVEQQAGGATRGMWIGIAVAGISLFVAVMIGAVGLYIASQGP